MSILCASDIGACTQAFKLAVINSDRIPLGKTNMGAKQSHKLMRIACGFDIETNKDGFMYIWQFSYYVKGYHDEPQYIIGRTWQQFMDLINLVIMPFTIKDKNVRKTYLKDNKQLKVQKGELLIGVHNLKFEWQWIRSIFRWSNVFSSDARAPYYAILEGINDKMSGIKFVDTLKLWPMPLKKVPKVTNGKLQKAVNDLDYNIPRNSQTELTTTEMGYCTNDVGILSYALDYLFDNFIIPEGKVPVSQTSQIRHKILKEADSVDNNGKKKYKHILNLVKISVMSIQMYKYLRGQEIVFNDKKHHLAFFEAGYTHANALYSAAIQSDIFHFDYTSSYPYVMLTENYPYEIIEEFISSDVDDYWFDDRTDFILELELDNVEPNTTFGVLSKSKCVVINEILDNGKIYKASKVICIKTRREWETYKKYYTCTVKVRKAYRCKLAPLPAYVTKNIIEQYHIKAEIKMKGLNKHPDYVNKYEEAKQFVNGIFGMMVTEIHLENFEIDDGHNLVKKSRLLEEIQREMAKSPLLAQWGMFVTMYARTRLLDDIWVLRNSFVYSDTDSAFFHRNPDFLKYIEKRNSEIKAENMELFKDEMLEDIGCYDLEKHCNRFKTCGAKCYIEEWDEPDKETGHLWAPTISGIAKDVFYDFCVNNKFDPFDLVESAFIQKELTHKLVPEYFDSPRKMIVTDAQGHSEEMFEITSQRLKEVEWTNSLPEKYARLIQQIQVESKKLINISEL